MINKEFMRTAAGAVLALSSMALAPNAMAESDVPACTPADKAKVVNLTQQYGVPTFDFTNSSTDCFKHYASGLSHKYLVYAAESDSPAWRNATVEAAKIDKKEGIPVAVVVSQDRDNDPKTAATYAWANGAELDIAPSNVKKGYTVEMVVSASPHTSIDEIHKMGHDVYTKYHNLIPPVALNQE